MQGSDIATDVRGLTKVLLDLKFWQRQQGTLGLLAIIIGAGAWGMEFTGTVYICPYCRVQRTVILLLGIIMVLPFARHWTIKYLASVMGFMGAVVAVNQNFMGWAKISKGEFAFNEQLYIDPFLLSGGSLFIIIGQLWLLLGSDSGNKAPE
ncbi:MAG: disulfide bond formation protein B [Luminiphilus sp.]